MFLEEPDESRPDTISLKVFFRCAIENTYYLHKIQSSTVFILLYSVFLVVGIFAQHCFFNTSLQNAAEQALRYAVSAPSNDIKAKVTLILLALFIYFTFLFLVCSSVNSFRAFLSLYC